MGVSKTIGMIQSMGFDLLYRAGSFTIIICVAYETRIFYYV